MVGSVKAQVSAQSSDCLLVQAAVRQGGTDTKLGKRTQAGATGFSLAQIVTVGPVQQGTYAFLMQVFQKKAVQPLFAEITAVFLVGDKAIPSKRFYIDDSLLDCSCRVSVPFPPGVDTFLLLFFLKTGAGMEHQYPVRPQGIKGGTKKERGVDSAGKGYSRPVKTGEKAAELFGLFFQPCSFSGSKEKSALGK
jgi:hypothetical protein